MKTCPSCNTLNDDSVQFCVSCGTPFAKAAPQVDNALTCPSCATANPPDAQFCVSCGAPLNVGFGPGAEQRTVFSAGRVPEPPPDIPAAAPAGALAADATVLVSKLRAATPPADATVLSPYPPPAATPPADATVLSPYSPPAATPPADATVLSPYSPPAWNPPAASAPSGGETVLAPHPGASAWYPDLTPPAPAAPPLSAGSAPKGRGVALALEIFPSLIGIFGIGWIYGGNMMAGVILLIAMLVWEGLGLVAAFFTLGAACLCVLPINLVVIAVSSFLLYNYTKQHPERFGA